MTERLYYDNSYLIDFSARVTSCEPVNGTYAVKLDKSAFYPTSGGQPFDTGVIGASIVLDVIASNDGDIVHMTNAPVEVNSYVECHIDWKRRFDHMQQHAGEHMLANAAFRMLGGMTIGLHLGVDISTIDMTLPDGKTHITDSEIRALEDDVNSRIQRDVPIRCWFPDENELKTLPLRKPPAVSEHVRVVQIGELEFCACGGTHPSSAGQIGLVKIVEARPSRGKLRLGFVCGKRAYNLLRENYTLAHTTADSLSTSVYNLPTMVCSLSEKVKSLEYELLKAQKSILTKSIPDMLNAAKKSASGATVVAQIIEGDISIIREIATKLTENRATVAFLGALSGDKYLYVAAKSQDLTMDMGKILSTAAKATGGKGGGKPEFAQGGGSREMLDELLSISLSA